MAAAEQRDDDGAVLDGVERGEPRALLALFDRHGGTLLALAERIVGERRVAEQVLDGLFSSLPTLARERPRAAGASLGWLCAIARARALAAVGREAAVPLTVEAAATPPTRAAARAALARLTDEERGVLELGYFDGLPLAGIAARLGLPVDEARRRLAGAARALRAALSPDQEAS